MIPRQTMDKLALLAVEAVVAELERSKAEGKPPHHSVMGAAVKILGSIEVAKGEEPIVEPPKANTREPVNVMEDLRRKGKLGLMLPFLTDEERVALDMPLPTNDNPSDF